MARRAAFIALAIFASVACGCAEGGRAPLDLDRDAGLPAVDGGSGMDATAGTDSGAPTDAGGSDVGPVTDAGTDSGPRLVVDAGSDSGPSDAGCTSAAVCSDGLVCNGVERCESGRCVAGTPPVCDDGIACTDDACTEPAGACEYVPNDTRCGAGESCTLTSGCMAGCSETPCKLVAPQCGCPTGQGCYIDGTGARSCSTAGANAPGTACTSITSCTPGSLCINIDRSGGTVAVCSPFCTSDSQCMGGLCFYTLDDGSGGSIPGVTLCTRACDPVGQTGCRTGAYCDIFQETAGAMRYFTDCTAPPMGSGGQGAACADVNQCLSGYTCADPGTGLQCMKWCNRSTMTGCTGLRTCIGFSPAIIAGGTEYGVCF